MLKIIVKDIKGRSVKLPVCTSLRYISSYDAPASSLEFRAVINSDVKELVSCELIYDGERIFSGIIDEQSESRSENGRTLDIRARSMEALLLDNEAKPQRYNLPGFDLLYERHFRPLGFKGYIGSDRAYNGELNVTKGKSEWSVLSEFCRKFTGTQPVITDDMRIDISGSQVPGHIHIVKDIIISLKKTIRRSALISEIYARTRRSGGYDMCLESDEDVSGIIRKRYVDISESRLHSIDEVQEMLYSTCSAYKSAEVLCSGMVFCRPGDRLVIEGEKRCYIVKELCMTFSAEGERTRIKAEVERNVA